MAGEVLVDSAGLGPGVLHDQPPAALDAKHRPLEVVIVGTGALSVAADGEDVLHGRPSDRVDERLVAAGVLDAVVDDDALAVGMAEQMVQPVHGQRLGGCVRSRPGAQAAGLQLRSQSGDAPSAAGVGVERPDDVLGPVPGRS